MSDYVKGIRLTVSVLAAISIGCSENLNNGSGVTPAAAAAVADLGIDPTVVSVFTSGQTSFTAIGGTPPYSFAVDSGCPATITSSGINGLLKANSTTGSCTVTATDKAGKTSTATVTIVQPAATATYSWLAGGFGACSVICGGGTQTRTVTCESSTGTAASSNSLCTATEPATSQACNTQACVGTLNAITGAIAAGDGTTPSDSLCAPYTGDPEIAIVYPAVAGKACTSIGAQCYEPNNSGSLGIYDYVIYQCELAPE